MQINDGERLLLHILCPIATKLEIDLGGVDFEFVQEALVSGNDWAIPAKYPFLKARSIRPEVVPEVLEILSMWKRIEEIEGEAFPGFDDNREEAHCAVAVFATEHFDHWASLKGRVHHGLGQLDTYRRMLGVYKMLMASGDRPLTQQEVESLMQAR